MPESVQMPENCPYQFFEVAEKAGEVPPFRGNKVRIYRQNPSLCEEIRRDCRTLGPGFRKGGKVGQGRTLWGRLCQCETRRRVAGGGVCGLPEAGNQKGATRGRWGLRGPWWGDRRVRAIHGCCESGSSGDGRWSGDSELPQLSSGGRGFPAGGVEIKKPPRDQGAALSGDPRLEVEESQQVVWGVTPMPELLSAGCLAARPSALSRLLTGPGWKAPSRSAWGLRGAGGGQGRAVAAALS